MRPRPRKPTTEFTKNKPQTLQRSQQNLKKKELECPKAKWKFLYTVSSSGSGACATEKNDPRERFSRFSRRVLLRRPKTRLWMFGNAKKSIWNKIGSVGGGKMRELRGFGPRRLDTWFRINFSEYNSVQSSLCVDFCLQKWNMSRNKARNLWMNHERSIFIWVLVSFLVLCFVDVNINRKFKAQFPKKVNSECVFLCPEVKYIPK